MSHEATAQERLDRLEALGITFDPAEVIAVVQAHATLAVAEELRRLVRVLVEKERR